MYSQVYFEVSGYCNARCPWCVKGNGRLQSCQSQFISPEEFELSVARLIDEKLAGPDTVFNLYNFGEPVLHPSLAGILRILADHNLRYTISTNASVFRDMDPDLFKNILRFYVSMPGFSQRSYDRIHGFDFEKILNNIDAWTGIIGAERMQVQFHLYRFNRDEVASASDYFSRRGIPLFPYCALFNDFELGRSYLNQTMNGHLLDAASGDLILEYVDTLLKTRPEKFICPQLSILTIDEYSRVLTCCLLSKADPDYSIGSLSALTKDEIEREKASRKTCEECMDLGLAFWVHHVFCPEFAIKYRS
jgi:organic radical activating enzyme